MYTDKRSTGKQNKTHQHVHTVDLLNTHSKNSTIKANEPEGHNVSLLTDLLCSYCVTQTE